MVADGRPEQPAERMHGAGAGLARVGPRRLRAIRREGVDDAVIFAQVCHEGELLRELPQVVTALQLLDRRDGGQRERLRSDRLTQPFTRVDEAPQHPGQARTVSDQALPHRPQLARGRHIFGARAKRSFIPPLAQRPVFEGQRARDGLLDPATHGAFDLVAIRLIAEVELQRGAAAAVDPAAQDALRAVVDALLDVSMQGRRDLDRDSDASHDMFPVNR